MDDACRIERPPNERLNRLNYELSREGGHGFLSAFVTRVSDLFDADFVFLGRLNAARRIIRTVEAACDGERSSNFTYDLDGTPCADVLRSNACLYPDNVAALFPQDFMLEEMGIRAYAGMPLFEGAQPIGIVVALFKHPLDLGEELLGVFNHYKRRLALGLLTSEREERSTLALDGTSDGVLDWCLQTDHLFLSARCRQLLGYDARDVSGTSDLLLSRLHRDDRGRMRAAPSPRLRPGRDRGARP